MKREIYCDELNSVEVFSAEVRLRSSLVTVSGRTVIVRHSSVDPLRTKWNLFRDPVRTAQ